jgi:hypothetical protein
MEVVISLAECHQRRKHVISRTVPIIERLFTQPMRQRIDAKRGLLNDKPSQNPRIHKAAPPITPAKSGNDCGKHPRREHHNDREVSVLPYNHWVVIQIRDVRATPILWILLHQDPAHVRIVRAFLDRIGVLDRVGPAVMRAVLAAPPPNRSLNCACASCGEEKPQRKLGRIAAMRPQPVVARRDAKPGTEVVQNSPYERRCLQFRVERRYDTDQRYEDGGRGVNPVNMFVPCLQRDRLLADVWLFWRVSIPDLARLGSLRRLTHRWESNSIEVREG